MKDSWLSTMCSRVQEWLTVAVLKGAGVRPEVREELIRVVRNGK